MSWRRPPLLLDPVIDRALEEDLAQGDVTTDVLAQILALKDTQPADTQPPLGRVTAHVVTRQPCVVSGMDVFLRLWQRLSEGGLPQAAITATPGVRPGQMAPPGTVLATLVGPWPLLLMGERTALNFLQHLCGVATATRAWVEALAETSARVADTRKTTPGLRYLEKQAVRDGGGAPHRYHLGGAVLLKDNHLAMLGADAQAAPPMAQLQAASPEMLQDVLAQVRRRISHTMTIELELDHHGPDMRAWVEAAIAGGVDVLLLDNMLPGQVAEISQWVARRVIIEVSGGLRLENARAYAEAGADFLSTSAITAGAHPIDIGLDMVLS
jgi:nicotinate-nucleotide pyrophosphorylase (carboxylating)